MAARMTIERIQRDSDDDSGQSVRDWKIEGERGHVKICLKHGPGFILMRPDDVDLFVADLQRMKDAAQSLAD